LILSLTSIKCDYSEYTQ